MQELVDGVYMRKVVQPLPLLELIDFAHVPGLLLLKDAITLLQVTDIELLAQTRLLG